MKTPIKRVVCVAVATAISFGVFPIMAAASDPVERRLATFGAPPEFMRHLESFVRPAKEVELRNDWVDLSEVDAIVAFVPDSENLAFLPAGFVNMVSQMRKDAAAQGEELAVSFFARREQFGGLLKADVVIFQLKELQQRIAEDFDVAGEVSADLTNCVAAFFTYERVLRKRPSPPLAAEKALCR